MPVHKSLETPTETDTQDRVNQKAKSIVAVNTAALTITRLKWR